MNHILVDDPDFKLFYKCIKCEQYIYRKAEFYTQGMKMEAQKEFIKNLDDSIKKELKPMYTENPSRYMYMMFYKNEVYWVADLYQYPGKAINIACCKYTDEEWEAKQIIE